MLVSDIMTKNVVTIESGEPVLQAAKKYKECGVGCLVVMNDNLVVGILTERDIIERIIIDEKNPKKIIVEDIMSRNIKTIHAAARVEQAAEMMKTYKIKKLPVILNNEIVGIVTATDIANNMEDFSKEYKQIFKDKTPFKFVEKKQYTKQSPDSQGY
jgi:CBS domain-containing protein